MHTVEKARAMLTALTPLSQDCGRLCCGACCKPSEEADSGMLLFPGEELLYAHLPDFRIKEAALGKLLICSGQCNRKERPLSCRLFPLLPVMREDRVHVVMDRRGYAVCPLTRQGKQGLREDFVRGVQAVGDLLAEDAVQRAFLLRLTHEQDELRALRAQFGGKHHV